MVFGKKSGKNRKLDEIWGKKKSWLGRFWGFLKEDTWQSWLVSLVLAFLLIKFVFFPVMSFIFATPLPLVVIESCSMYHNEGFDNWWESNAAWYENKEIWKGDFKDFPFNNGLNKGDIILVSGRGGYGVGDVIVFESKYKFPLIHRIVEFNPKISTKGDKNFEQLPNEKDILEESVIGKSLMRIPALGWVKLIFVEWNRPESERGFCK